MSRYRTFTVDVETDVSEFDTDDLLDELESRGSLPQDADSISKKLLETIWLKRRQGNYNYQSELDQLIYHTLGHVV
jgi:hypothetical protein